MLEQPLERPARGGFDLPSEELVVRDLPLVEHRFAEGSRDPRRALICVPGMAASGRSFARLQPLADAWDVRMVTGPLDRPYPGDPVASLTDVIVDYASRFERPVLLGTSFGGLVAIGAALRMRDRIAGLVLTAAFADGTRLGHLPFMRELLPLLQIATAPLAPVTARVVGGAGLDTDARAAVIDDVLAMPIDERSRRLRTIFATNLLPRVPEIEVPSLVIHGLRDMLVPRARAVEMARALPRCDYHEIRRAGHLPYVTHADEFVAIVRDWRMATGERR